MDKCILCLANSYKHGGRCIAGVEVVITHNGISIVRDANGIPKWLRPVSHSIAGEVPNSHASTIKVLSIVKITGIEYAGMYSHSEDVYYKSLSVVGEITSTRNVLNSCLDNYHSTIFGNRGKALTPECFQNGTYSVMLVFAKNPEMYIDTRFDYPKARMKFVHNGNNYDLPITDPIYLNRIKNENIYGGIIPDAFLVLSLGIEHEGWHSKLIAAVIEVREEVEQIVNLRLNTHVDNMMSNTPIKQDITIEKAQQTRDSETNTETILPTKYKRKDYESMSLRELQTEIHKDEVLSSEERAALKSAYRTKISSMIRCHSKLEIDSPQDKLNKVLPTNTSTSKQKSEGCYIATMAYGSYDHPQVMVLRWYRDNVLKRTSWGRLFILIYYYISPKLVIVLKRHNAINKIIRYILDKKVQRIIERKSNKELHCVFEYYDKV